VAAMMMYGIIGCGNDSLKQGVQHTAYNAVRAVEFLLVI